jgi:hypothetical protein
MMYTCGPPERSETNAISRLLGEKEGEHSIAGFWVSRVSFFVSRSSR